MIDQALGESSYVRYRSSMLQSAVHGLFRALDGWRGVATHLNRSAVVTDRQSAETILYCIPPELRSVREPGLPARWMADPVALRRACEDAIRRLLVLPTGKPSLRLLADETAKVLGGMMRVLDGLALLVDAPGQLTPGHQGVQLGVPDWLPALVNAARAFITIGVVELFWVATAWPNGASAIVFAAIVVLLLSPKGDLAFGGSIAFVLGTGAAVICAALMKFAVLPGHLIWDRRRVAISLKSRARHPIHRGVYIVARPIECRDCPPRAFERSSAKNLRFRETGFPGQRQKRRKVPEGQRRSL